jgi:hypothetical protein
MRYLSARVFAQTPSPPITRPYTRFPSFLDRINPWPARPFFIEPFCPRTEKCHTILYSRSRTRGAHGPNMDSYSNTPISWHSTDIMIVSRFCTLSRAQRGRRTSYPCHLLPLRLFTQLPSSSPSPVCPALAPQGSLDHLSSHDGRYSIPRRHCRRGGSLPE